MVRVTEISTVSELLRIQGDWERLWTQTPQASIFESFDWVYTYWRYFGTGQHLHVLAVEDDGETIGIVPCVVHDDQRRMGRVRVAAYLNAGWGSFYHPLGPCPQATLNAAAHYWKEAPPADLVELAWIPSQGALLHDHEEAFREAGLAHQVHPYDEVYVVDFDGSFDAYWSARKAKFREGVRRNERRLAKRGTLRFVRYRPTAGEAAADGVRWDLYDDCCTVAIRSWQSTSTTGTTVCHESVRPFLKEMFGIAARRGMLDLNLLYVDEAPVAFAYNFHRNGVIQGLRTGFDAAHRSDGVGKLLWYYLIRDGFRRGDRWLDMGPQYARAKAPWMTRVVATAALRHYPATAKGQLLRVAHWLVHRKYPPDAPWTVVPT